MTTISDIFSNISERLRSSATVKTVYGEQIEFEDKIIIPVAKVRYGFGAGGGSGTARSEEATEGATGEGYGGGGGVEVTPIGIIEITADETRYISLEGPQRVIKAVVIATIIIGFFLWRRRRRS